MKLSEKLSELKRKEGELMRTYGLRDSIMKQGFKESVLLSGEEDVTVLETKKREYLGKKKIKIEEMNIQIEELKEFVIKGKNEVNKKNVETGLDLKLAKMKFLRLELSKIMTLMKKDRYLSSGFDIDIDVWEELGIADRIKTLETEKAKLDSEIQSVNWSTDL